MVPQGPVVSGPSLAIPWGAVAPANPLPVEKPKPPVPMSSGETAGSAGRVGVRFSVPLSPSEASAAGEDVEGDDDEHAAAPRAKRVERARTRMGTIDCLGMSERSRLNRASHSADLTR